MKIAYFSHYFPPYAGVGSIRAGYFVNYLAQKGIDITLFKADDSVYAGATLETDSKCSKYNVVNVDLPDSEFTKRLGRRWCDAYLRAFEKEMAISRFDCLIFSLGPFDYLGLGYIVKKKYGIPYILDFRDYPKKSIELRYGFTGIIRQLLFNINRWLGDDFREPVLNAEYVITVSDGEKKHIMSDYSVLSEKRVSVVRNGYDDSKPLYVTHASIYHPVQKGCVTIGVFGKFSYYSEADALMLLNSCVSLSKSFKIKIVHVGEPEKVFSDAKTSSNLDVEQLGYMEYETGLKVMSGCDCLVLNNRSNFAMGTKIYDYILLNLPVLAFVDESSEIAEILSEFEHGYIVNNMSQCAQVLTKIYNVRPMFLCSDYNPLPYSRRSQVSHFFDIISSVGN